MVAQTGLLASKPVIKGAANKFIDLFSKPEDVDLFAQQLARFSDDGGAQLLAEMMVREGVTPEEIAKRLSDLGPDAIPADTSNSFRRLLNEAANKIPRIEGHANQVLGERAVRQAGALDDVTKGFFAQIDNTTGSTLSADDAITRLEVAFKPVVSERYRQAGSQSLSLPPAIRALLEGDSAIGQAARSPEVQQNLTNLRSLGEEVTNFDWIDQTKRHMDDLIGAHMRAGRGNEARMLTRLKNRLIDVADKQLPEYAEARSLFAGRKNLENAVNFGKTFFDIDASQIDEIIEGMGNSELTMFRIGARDAILDRISKMPAGKTDISSIFGTNGDIKNLKSVFDNAEGYDQFVAEMQRQAQFILTRRAVNPRAILGAQDQTVSFWKERIKDIAFMFRAARGDPIAGSHIFRTTVSDLGKGVDTAEYVRGLETAGDVLLESGMNPERIRQILTSGNQERIKDVFSRVAIDMWNIRAPSVRAGSASLTNEALQ